MSYSRDIRYSDSPNLDAFGRVRTSDAGNRLDVEFIYGKQEDVMDEVTAGTGTVTFNSNSRDLTLATNAVGAGNNAAMYSYSVPYTPGCSQLIDITGALNNANISGGVAQIIHRSSVTGSVVETIYDQLSWSFDGVNTYSSHSDVNWSYSQIFMMDFQSLKVGRIRFYLNRGGVIVPVHSIENDNIRNTGYWQSPSLPVSWRIYNESSYTYMELGYGDADNGIAFRYRVSTNASATLRAICATVKSEGGLDLFDLDGFPSSIDRGTSTKTISTSLVPLLSIRARSTFNSVTNRVLFVSIEFSVQTDNPVKVALYHDNTLTGASWNNVDTNNSAMEYDISASAFSNGHLFHSEYVASVKNVNTSGKGVAGRAILWLPRGSESGIITLAAVRTTSTNADMLASLKWREIR